VNRLISQLLVKGFLSARQMQFVPWRHVADWRCTTCGECCRLYSVVLNFHEWLKIVKGYGFEQTVSGLNKLFIKRKGDGSCAFLCSFSNVNVCGLQYMKPKACKLWPFKVLAEPKYGFAKEAAYRCGTNTVFVYADSMCNGLKYGTPSWEFANNTLKEFAEIAMGLSLTQHRTTSKIGFLYPYSAVRTHSSGLRF
jgi:Fe-S-cluster containining protein